MSKSEQGKSKKRNRKSKGGPPLLERKGKPFSSPFHAVYDIIDGLLKKHTYEETIEILRKEHGIDRSKTSLNNWVKRQNKGRTRFTLPARNPAPRPFGRPIPVSAAPKAAPTTPTPVSETDPRPRFVLEDD